LSCPPLSPFCLFEGLKWAIIIAILYTNQLSHSQKFLTSFTSPPTPCSCLVRLRLKSLWDSDQGKDSCDITVSLQHILDYGFSIPTLLSVFHKTGQNTCLLLTFHSSFSLSFSCHFKFTVLHIPLICFNGV
jgi:hypothetical protein